MNRDIALKWLYGQLRKKRIALGEAERRSNARREELDNIQAAIDTIEWIIGKVLEGEEHI